MKLLQSADWKWLMLIESNYACGGRSGRFLLLLLLQESGVFCQILVLPPAAQLSKWSDGLGHDAHLHVGCVAFVSSATKRTRELQILEDPDSNFTLQFHFHSGIGNTAFRGKGTCIKSRVLRNLPLPMRYFHFYVGPFSGLGNNCPFVPCQHV